MDSKKINMGLIAGHMDGFSETGLELFEQHKQDLANMADASQFHLITYDGVIKDFDSAVQAREQIAKDQIDFLMIHHPAYARGDYIYEIMKPVNNIGLWALGEPQGKTMSLASMVNMEQNAGIAKHNFKGRPKKVKWFFGNPDGPYFKPRFDLTVPALYAQKNLRNTRVAQIGRLAPGHINHMVDARTIYEKLGVDVVRDFEIEDVVHMAESVKEKEVQGHLARLQHAIKCESIPKEKILFSVKLFYVIEKLCREHHYKAVAFSCFPKLGEMKDLLGCVVNSLLNSAGIPAGCEGDVLGTISMLVLHYLTGRETALMDLPVFDPEDESLLLWHCGSAPMEMSSKEQITCQRHYWSQSDDRITLGPIQDIILKASDITVFRITEECQSYYYFTGKTGQGEKPSFKGSRGWVDHLSLFMKPVQVMDLANTLLTNGLSHHFPMVMDRAAKVIEEFAYWQGLKKMKRIDYQDYATSE